MREVQLTVPALDPAPDPKTITKPGQLKQWVEENMGIPTMALETDNFDTRSYSAEALRTRVETFADMLRARKVTMGV